MRPLTGLIVVAGLAMLTAGYFFHGGERGGEKSEQDRQAATSLGSQQCQPQPDAVVAFDFPESGYLAGMPKDSTLHIGNIRDTLAVLILSSNGKPVKAIGIPPSLSAKVSLPKGNYQAEMLIGRQWCNLETGFIGGSKISFNGGLELTPGIVTTLQFTQTGLSEKEFSTRITAQPETRQAHSQGMSLTLDIEKDGHFYSAGTVNGHPTRFLIDTGASAIAVSGEFARRAGITGCVEFSAITANGRAQGCQTTVPHLTFGPFTFNNATVLVVEQLAGESLIGMDILRRFRIMQDGPQMILTAKES